MKNYDILDDILTANRKVEFSNSPNLLSLAETLYILITYTCSIHILIVHYDDLNITKIMLKSVYDKW